MKKAVAGILIRDDSVLIGKKIIKEGHFCSGGWHIPGGHVNKGERVEIAIVREFKEETGLDVVVRSKLCKHQVKETGVELHWFVLTSASRKAVPGDDLSELKFVEKSLVQNMCDIRAVRLWSPEVLSYLQN